MSQFRSAKDEQCLLERATPRSTKYATKLALKFLMNAWRASKQIKEVNSAEDGLDSTMLAQFSH